MPCIQFPGEYMLPASDLDQAAARIRTMRDLTMHLVTLADAMFSGSLNDELHRSWFVQLAERIMSHAVRIGLLQAFRVQCDGETNPDPLRGTACLRAEVFYQEPGAKWCSMELILGDGQWFIVDGEMESDQLEF
jgi:hypothetical protein